MKRRLNTSSRTGTDVAARRLSTEDGKLAFLASPAPQGVYLERIQTLSGGGNVTHAMLVRTVADFFRFLETDELRFDHPLLYDKVRRHIEEMLDATR